MRAHTGPLTDAQSATVLKEAEIRIYSELEALYAAMIEGSKSRLAPWFPKRFRERMQTPRENAINAVKLAIREHNKANIPIAPKAEPAPATPPEPHWFKKAAYPSLFVGLLLAVIAYWTWYSQQSIGHGYDARQKIAAATVPVLERFANATFPHGATDTITAPNIGEVSKAIKALDSSMVVTRASLLSRFSPKVVAGYDSLTRMKDSLVTTIYRLNRYPGEWAKQKAIDGQQQVLSTWRADYLRQTKSAATIATNLQSTIVAESNK